MGAGELAGCSSCTWRAPTCSPGRSPGRWAGRGSGRPGPSRWAARRPPGGRACAARAARVQGAHSAGQEGHKVAAGCRPCRPCSCSPTQPPRCTPPASPSSARARLLGRHAGGSRQRGDPVEGCGAGVGVHAGGQLAERAVSAPDGHAATEQQRRACPNNVPAEPASSWDAKSDRERKRPMKMGMVASEGRQPACMGEVGRGDESRKR